MRLCSRGVAQQARDCRQTQHIASLSSRASSHQGPVLDNQHLRATKPRDQHFPPCCAWSNLGRLSLAAERALVAACGAGSSAGSSSARRRGSDATPAQRRRSGMPPPESFLQWCHQTYESQWKGRLAVSTVPDGRSEDDKAMWAATIAASCAVVQDASGQHVTLPPLSGTGRARSKKAAQQAAAADLYKQLVAGGWHDPDKPAPPRKTGGVVSARAVSARAAAPSRRHQQQWAAGIRC